MRRYLVLFLFLPIIFLLLQSCQQKEKAPNETTANSAIVNEKLGELFLAKNKLKEGVVITSTGLQYYIVSPGVGEHPQLSDLATVYYQGQFLNGQAFDTKYFQDHSLTVPISSLIPGWQQALTSMQTGSVWIIFVPPKLAFGERGVPGLIPPNETLVYRIHLVGFNKK